jgi:predicted transcriptional regulator
MALTYKKHKEGKAKAVFAVYFGLTEEEVAVIQRLADSEGNMSLRQLLKRIAVQAIEEKIAANR